MTPIVVLAMSLVLSAEPIAGKIDGVEADFAMLKAFRDGFVALPIEKRAAEGAVAKPLAVHRYETTQGDYAAIMGSNPSRWTGDRNSVEMVSFDDAEAFCRKVTRALHEADLIDEGQVVRLPTEAEWSFAARAGAKTKYAFGDDPAKLGDYAWFHGNAAGNDPPVGAKRPNAFGLYDMHGYVWEWCTATPADGAGQDREDERSAALRGGSWKDDAEKLTLDYRRSAKVDLKDDAVGFRCVLAPADADANDR